MSDGGNHFFDYSHFLLTGTDYLMLGNGDPDSFDLDLEFTTTGYDNVYLARNSAGNYVGGDLTINHAPTIGSHEGGY